MFNSAIIDVAIGMVLSFLAVSLAASAITEAISSWGQWREKTLADGIQALLNYHPEDRPLALDLYKSALISPLTSGTAKSFEDIEHKPAYIDSRQFALAFSHRLGQGAGAVRRPVFVYCDHKLAHGRRFGPLRRLFLVRHAPANHSPQGDGSRAETERQAAAA